jgi:hypothetical protein
VVVQGQHKHRHHARAIMTQLVDVVLHLLAAGMRNSCVCVGGGGRRHTPAAEAGARQQGYRRQQAAGSTTHSSRT